MRFVRSVHIEATLQDVFDFHLAPANVIRVAPPHSHTALISVTHSRLQVGTRVYIRSVQAGIPIRMEAEVIELVEPVLLRDRQVSGPFHSWLHTHRFEQEGSRTRLTDEIEYSLPLGPFGGLVMGRTISRELTEMFAFRQEATRRLLEGAARTAQGSRA